MAADPPNGVQRDLGIVLGKVEEINRRLDRSDESRQRTYERMDAMGRDVTEIKAKVSSIEEDVTEMKPEVALVRGLRLKAGGAIVVLGLLGAMIGWAFATFGSALKAALFRGG